HRIDIVDQKIRVLERDQYRQVGGDAEGEPASSGAGSAAKDRVRDPVVQAGHEDQDRKQFPSPETVEDERGRGERESRAGRTVEPPAEQDSGERERQERK